jgi:hypothetical protein
MYAPVFKPGDSLVSLPLPVGWGSLLFKYGLGRAKLAEQNVGDYSKLEDDFIKKLSEWYKMNRVVVGPKQVPGGWESADSLETWGSGQGGGFVIP